MAAGVLWAGTAGAPLPAQTDYYNTDAGRPVRIEDAYPVERYAFEAQVAPLRLERSGEGIYSWEFEPELAYGILPGTNLEIGVPLSVADLGRDAEFGVRGIDLTLFHNLNVETSTLPALGVSASVRLPVGGAAPDETYTSFKGIATQTFRIARVHLNGQYTLGPSPDGADPGGELSRWMAGVAVDKTLPLRSLLLIADVFLEQPLQEAEDLHWTVEAGTRYQLNPFFALDAGVGRRMSGPEQEWFVTFGAARAFALRSLMPGRGH